MQFVCQWAVRCTLSYALLSVFSLQADAQYREIGMASYYADYLHGRPTASGERYDRGDFSCAHRTHPFGTLLKVTRLDNGASVIVRVNDKGAFPEGFVVSLSMAAAMTIGLEQTGKARVQVEPVGQDGLPAPVSAAVPAAYSDEMTARTPFATQPYVPAGLTEKLAEPNPAMPTSRELLPKTNPSVATPTQQYEYGPVPTTPPAYAPPGTLVKSQLPVAYESALGTLPPPYPPVKGTVVRIARGFGGFGVQLGAFSDNGNAERQATAFAELGIASVFVQEGMDSHNIRVFRLIAGNFQTRIEAERYLVQIREQYHFSGFIVNM